MTAILTVDDSASIRQAIKIALSGEGYQVTEAVNGADGLEKALGAFDLMIRELRKRPAQAGVPILFLTTESDAEIKQQAKAAGATGWLTKPFDPEQLVRIVKKVLAK
jgi:two-component system chemotaxis response regulator CheY